MTKLLRQALNPLDADDARNQLIAKSLLCGFKMKRGSGSRPSQNGLYVVRTSTLNATQLQTDEKVEWNTWNASCMFSLSVSNVSASHQSAAPCYCSPPLDWFDNGDGDRFALGRWQTNFEMIFYFKHHCLQKSCIPLVHLALRIKTQVLAASFATINSFAFVENMYHK